MKRAWVGWVALSLTNPGICAVSPDIPKSCVEAESVDYVSATLFSENDLYTIGTESDRYYTTGQKLTVISGRIPRFEDAFQVRWAKWLARKATEQAERKDNSEAAKKGSLARYELPVQMRAAFSVGQNMFTPAALHTPDLQVEDRPYAAWLYLSVALQARSVSTGSRAWLSVWGADAGVVGPAALGKEVQDFVHDHISKSRRALGWSHQLRNEPGLNLFQQSKVRWFYGERNQLGFDVISHAGFSVGNIATYLNAGGVLRFGYGLPDDFGTDVIRSGADTSQAGGKPAPWGVHAFGGFDLRAVGRDISLDGNTFTASHHVAREVLVGDFQFGLTLNCGRAKICLSQVRRTPQFKRQGHAQAYGSLTVTFPISSR